MRESSAHPRQFLNCRETKQLFDSVINGVLKVFGLGKMATISDKVKISIFINSKDGAIPTVEVKVHPLIEVSENDIRIGLHWLKADNSWGGCLADKKPRNLGHSYFQAGFTLDEVVGMPDESNKLIPIVFFTPDGSIEKAWFRTSVEDALANDLVASFDKDNLFVLGEIRDLKTVCGKVKARIYVNPKNSDMPTIEVMLRPLVEVSAKDIRVGLHWLREDNSWGGWIDDKTPSNIGHGSFLVGFPLCNIENVLNQAKKVIPLIFFTPDGSIEKAWFKMDVLDSVNNGLTIPIDENIFRMLKNVKERAHDRELQRLKHIGSRLDISARVDTRDSDKPTVKVEIQNASGIPKEYIRVGLHWLLDDENYGGWIADKIPTSMGYGDNFQVEFTLNEMGDTPRDAKKIFPIVFIVPDGDGKIEKAIFKTDLNYAKNKGLIVPLFGKTYSTLNKYRDKRLAEKRCIALKEAAYIYLDGNNLCWDDSRVHSDEKSLHRPKAGVQIHRQKDTSKKKGDNIGIALIDRLLLDLKKEEVRARIPKAEIRLFFDDGGKILRYPLAYINRLNNGNVKACAGKADQEILDESEKNGSTDNTFIISGDHFSEFAEDKSVVKEGRLLKPEIDGKTIRIPDLGVIFSFDTARMAHLPLYGFPFKEVVSIKAYSNGKFLCADDAGNPNERLILANRDISSDWEKFMIVRNSDGTISIKSRANGKYLSAMINSDGRLIAWTDVNDAWEKFWITKRKKGGHYILRSYANMKYVTVIPETGLVVAQVDVADEWEWLTISPCK